jgi:hypothetical protein
MTSTMDSTKTQGGFDWLAAVFYPLAVVLMESFWVYPWLAWLGGWPAFDEARPILSLAAVTATLAASLLVTRLALRQKWELWRIRAAVVGGGLVVILLVLAADYRGDYTFLSGAWFGYLWQALADTFSNSQTIVPAIPALLFLWWRGIILGQTTSYFRDIYRNFILGMAALIFLIIFWQISAASERFTAPGAEIGWFVAAFFFFGLISIAVSHLYTMRRSMPREDARLTSVWRWVPIMLGVILAMVLVGFGVASIFSPDLFGSIGGAVGTVGNWLGKIIGYILYPVIFVFEWIVRFFVFLLNLLRSDQQLPPEGSGNMTAPTWPEIIARDLPAWLTATIKYVVIALAVGLVLFILYKAVSRMRARRVRDEIEEIHESLWSWRGLRDDLKGLLGSLFKRKEALAAEVNFDENYEGEMDIREIYRHLLWEGKRSGLPRRLQETPGEYSVRLGHSVPESDVPLKDITREYESVRYGDNVVPDERVKSANGLWGKLKEVLRAIRGD